MPYLSVDDYIARYGEHETMLITDSEKTGAVDTAKVEEAISTAEEEANGYIGRRYAIPLASPPALVRGMIGSLARWYLFPNNRAQTVVDDAELARKQLAQISSGALTIPTATGIVEESASYRPSYGTSDDAPTPVFTEDNLAGFGIPSGAPLANWRR